MDTSKLETNTQTIDRLTKERDDLQGWKESALKVEAQWSPQAVGKALDLPLGSEIHSGILPAILKLKRERDDAWGVIWDVVQRSSGMDPAIIILINWLHDHKEAQSFVLLAELEPTRDALRAIMECDDPYKVESIAQKELARIESLKGK